MAPSLIDEIVREGPPLAEALQAEVDAYLAAFAAERVGHGHRSQSSATATTNRGRC